MVLMDSLSGIGEGKMRNDKKSYLPIITQHNRKMASVEALSVLVVRLFRCKEVSRWNWFGGQQEWCGEMRDMKND